MPKILIVEDDDSVRPFLELALRREGYEVSSVATGQEAWDRLQGSPADLVISDVMMPGVDGLELTKRIRAAENLSGLRIILLTAKGEQIDKLHGLQSGADDYVVKPFDSMELVLRVAAQFRHLPPPTHAVPPQKALPVGPISIDPITYQARNEEQAIALSKSEFAIVSYLLQHQRVISWRELLSEALAYPAEAGSPEIVRNHVRKIRQKFLTLTPIDVLKTVGKRGYTIARD